MNADQNQICISASSRGIVDHFFCFVCDEYVWDCDHLIDERLTASRVEAPEGSKLQSFAYDGGARLLEIEFRVAAPYTPGEIPLPPPPRVIQYFSVPRYVFTKLMKCATARRQERHWEDIIQRRFECQTVRTVCRAFLVYAGSPKLETFVATPFKDCVVRLSSDELKPVQIVLAAMKILLLQTLTRRRVVGLGGLMLRRG